MSRSSWEVSDAGVSVVCWECRGWWCSALIDDDGNESSRNLGLIVARGTLLVLISPLDGSEQIENPFNQADEWARCRNGYTKAVAVRCGMRYAFWQAMHRVAILYAASRAQGQDLLDETCMARDMRASGLARDVQAIGLADG
jgi:hypothetical protein